VALWDVLFIAQDFDVSPYEAVDDALAAVYMCAFHDDAVLDLGVADGGVVSDAGVWADVTVVADYCGASDCCSAVYDCAFSNAYFISYCRRILDGSFIVDL